MGIYSEYLDKSFDWASLEKERKKQLSRISKFRGGKAVFTFASAITKSKAPISIDYDDRVPILDQISNLKGDGIDVILETPGGYAEIVEDIVKHIRNKFSQVTMIVPGYAKSAGTIMVMAGDEILMEPASALGPIDAQVAQGMKRFSAHAFLEGLEKIKLEVEKEKKLNRAYVPILQNISPGEIQSYENALSFSKTLVTDWLSQYKFKFWEKHSSTGKPVKEEEKIIRAKEIAEELCDHGKWFSHGRSITINDLEKMRLQVTDYSKNAELCDAIRRYYTLLKMTFDTTSIFKIYETPSSIISRYETPPISPMQQTPDMKKAELDFECPKCNNKIKFQANLKKGVPLEKGAIPFPKDNVSICPKCKNRNDLSTFRRQLELMTKKKIV